MAKIQLSEGESAGITGNFDIYGTTSGAEKITILSPVGTYKFDASFNRGGDKITLPGSIFEWQIKRSGSSAILARDGITVNLPVGVAGTSIMFDNAAERLHVDVTSGKIYLGTTPLLTNFSAALLGGHAPQFQNADTFLIDEGAVGAFRAITSDADDNSIVTYALTDAADNRFFLIDPSSGAVRLKSAATYSLDKPSYKVEVLATDNTGLTATQTVAVIVRDRSDSSPTFASSMATVSVVEGQFLTGFTAAATQADSRDIVRYYIAGGPDADRFEIDQLSGQLAFRGAPTDYEKPSSSNGSNTYEVAVSAQDLSGHAAFQTVIVSVTDNKNETTGVITSASPAAGAALSGAITISCIENQMATGYLGLSQISAAGSYRFAISGTDASRFSINPATGALYFRSGGADFEAHNSAAGTNSYQVTVIATDGAGQKSTQAVTVKVTNEVVEVNPQKGGNFINNTADGGITFFGNSDNNLVVGTDRFDDLTGWTGDDYIRGLGGDDYLRGDPGDDTLEGSVGNDRLMGNEGVDTAFYASLSAQAQITQLAPGEFTVTTPDEGQDVLPFSDMELVRFTDCEVTLSSDLTTGRSFWTMGSKTALLGSDANDVFMLSEGGVFVDGRGGNDVAYLEASSDPVLTRINDTSWKVKYGESEYILTNIETFSSNGKAYNLTINSNSLQYIRENYALYATNRDDIFIINNPNQSVYGGNQDDFALVITDNYKTNSQVGTWKYASDVTALPYWINALLPNGAASFEPRLSDHVVYYAFPDTAPNYLSGSELSEFSKFNDDQRTYVRKLLAYISTVVDLRFVETTETERGGTITFFNTNADPNLGGYARYPDWGTPFDMDNVVNITSEESAAVQHKAPTTDNWGGASFIHEVGHSLGLKHPFTSQGDEPGYLPAEEAIKTYSVMAYDGWVITPTSWQFAELDLAALQYLYGPSQSARSGDDTYKISPDTNNFIWDGGGTDTIDLSALIEPCTVSLLPGFHGFVAEYSPLITAPGQVTINFKSEIENLIGSQAGDQLFGNDLGNAINGGAGDDWIDGALGNDQLTGGAGNDVIFGGLGTDTACFAGNLADYTISRSDTQVIVTSLAEGRDILCDIELLAFKDQTITVSSISLGTTLG